MYNFKTFLNTYKILIFTYLVFFLVSPLFSLIFVFFGLFFDRSKTKHYLFLFALFFGYIAFYFNPLIVDDLYRHYENMNKFSNMTMFNAIFYDMNILNNFLFYLFGKFHIELFYTLIGTTLTYYLSLLSAYKIINIKKYNKLQIIILYILSIVIWPFRLVVSGVRNFVVISILIYWFMVSKKKLSDGKSMIILLCCIFIHSYTIIFIFFYLCFKYIPSRYYKTSFFLLISLIFLADFITPYLNEISIVGYYASKYIAYRTVVFEYDLYSILFSLCRLMFILFVFVYAWKTRYKNKNLILISMIVIVSLIFNSRTFSERNYIFAALASLLILIDNINNVFCTKYIRHFNTVIFIIACIMFSILNYPTLRNFPMNKPVHSIMVTGFVHVLID